MFNNLRVYKLGDTYKYVAIPIKQKDKEIFKDINFPFNKFYNEDYVKRRNNLIRCKTNIHDLLLCNDFKFFITITFNNNFNRFDLDVLRKKINNKIRRLRLQYKDLNFSYLFIPEKHKNGAWHIHGFLSKDFTPFLYVSKNHKYLQCDIFDFFGYNNVEILYSHNVYNYVTKYISKDFENREKGKHLYFATQGLKRPQLVDNFVYNNTYFDRLFWDYKTDYCYMLYSKKRLNLELLKI